MRYLETFDDGPGGWYGWISNSAGPASLKIANSYAVSRILCRSSRWGESMATGIDCVQGRTVRSGGLACRKAM